MRSAWPRRCPVPPESSGRPPAGYGSRPGAVGRQRSGGVRVQSGDQHRQAACVSVSRSARSTAARRLGALAEWEKYIETGVRFKQQVPPGWTACALSVNDRAPLFVVASRPTTGGQRLTGSGHPARPGQHRCRQWTPARRPHRLIRLRRDPRRRLHPRAADAPLRGRLVTGNRRRRDARRSLVSTAAVTDPCRTFIQNIALSRNVPNQACIRQTLNQLNAAVRLRCMPSITADFPGEEM